MSSDKREYILQKLKEARPDLNLHRGDPIYYSVVDPGALLSNIIQEDLAEVRDITLDEKGENFFVPRTLGLNSNITIRFYFSTPITISYDPLIIFDDAGIEYESVSSVSRTAQEMSLYLQDDYYYVDVIMAGDGVFSDGLTLVWSDAPDEFSHLAVTTVTSTGQVAEDDDTYEVRIETDITLRNSVTRDGFPGLLDRLFGAQVRETLSIGFLDPEMSRDIIDAHHMGGYVDAMVKGNMMVNQQIKCDTVDELDRILERSITVLFTDGADISLWTNQILTYEVKSQVRPTPVTFVDTTNYTIDALTGVITRIDLPIVSLGIQHFNCLNYASYGIPGYPAGSTFIMTNAWSDATYPMNSATAWPGMLLIHDGDEYLVKSVAISAADTAITVDRPIISADTAAACDIYEPVRATLTYRPIGVELSDLDNPLMKIDSLFVLDAISDEETTIEIEPMGGFGAGTFGGGPFGYGDDVGYMLTVDDVDERYSIREEGVIEVPWTNYGDRFSINYRNLPDIADYQAAIIDHRTEAADTLVKAFTPVYVYIDIDIESTGDITDIDQYIWGLSGNIELSDLVTELYARGATMVDLDDLMENSEFIIWNPDGTYEHVYRTTAGVIELTDRTLRLYPIEIILDRS